MPRRNARPHAYTGRGARIETPRHGIVTVTGIRQHGRVLAARDRNGRAWELRRSGDRWTVCAPRAGAR